MESSHTLIVLILLAMGVKRIEPSSEVMKYINAGFVKVLSECKHELNLSDNILADLFHFWKLEYELLNRDTGCMIICMSKKLNLLDPTGHLHHGHAQEFALSHGADQELANKLVSFLHECEKKNDGVEDDCLRALEVAKCFRTDINNLDWTPKVQFIVEEVLTEV